ENRKYKLRKGDLILIRPSQYHFIQIDKQCRYERYNILFDAESHKTEGVELIPDGVEVISLEDNPIAIDIFHKCDFYHQNCSEEVFSKLLPHLLSELFFYLQLIPRSLANESSDLSPLISKVLRYMNKNLCTIQSMKEIADHVFVSESYLFRLFKKEMHQTPKKYILEKRLLMAQRMISMGEKPTFVCEKCGFLDYTTFYRNFISYFGNAPSEKVGGQLKKIYDLTNI
ncbi:MAG: helix-turn-helix transcriptional regulator, partial [Clostridia bacterium]|nr:helix-turn-helix transcriptional regulator [Clostridia bacterium]